MNIQFFEIPLNTRESAGWISINILHLERFLECIDYEGFNNNGKSRYTYVKIKDREIPIQELKLALK